MKIEVTVIDGSVDTYDVEDYGENLTASVEASGALIIKTPVKEDEVYLHSVYANGMWVKFEMTRGDADAEPSPA